MTPFPHLFSPLVVGTMHLRNRIMAPAHGGGPGDLLGDDDALARFEAYYVDARLRGGAAWLGGATMVVGDPVRSPPGFEAPDVGRPSPYHDPRFVERYRRIAERVHGAGACTSTQLVLLSHAGPTAVPAAPTSNVVSHRLDAGDLAAVAAELAWCAARAVEAGVDAVEVHANHDDLLERFLSPATNRRTDGWGGDLDGRLRLLVEVLEQVRAAVGDRATVGVRLDMDQLTEDGFALEHTARVVERLDAGGWLDYLHLDVGSSWGHPSYVPTVHVPEGRWAPLAGQLKALTSLAVVYTGRVASPEVAEAILAAGHADVVGMNRALIADPDLPRKAAEGRLDEIRPCVGGNDCLQRVAVEGLGFGCAANPSAGHELELPHPRPRRRRRVLVVGGGPAGLEAAATAAERGHRVELWERADHLGGQLAIAARAPAQEPLARLVEWYGRRLARLGVEVRPGRTATVEAVGELDPDVVVAATGATSRRPPIAGVDLAHVVDQRDVLLGTASVGGRVVVVAEDDHLAPLGVADLLSGQGREVTMVYATRAVAVALDQRSIGNVLGRLYERGVRFRVCEAVAAIEPGAVQVRNVFTQRRARLVGHDTVVLACGGQGDDALFHQLRAAGREVHLVGDAYAPRRLTYATRQGWAVGRAL